MFRLPAGVQRCHLRTCLTQYPSCARGLAAGGLWSKNELLRTTRITFFFKNMLNLRVSIINICAPGVKVESQLPRVQEQLTLFVTL